MDNTSLMTGRNNFTKNVVMGQESRRLELGRGTLLELAASAYTFHGWACSSNGGQATTKSNMLD